MASPTQIGIATFAATPREPDRTRPYFLVAATGLLNTLIVAFLFLHLPASHAPSLPSLALRATIFVLIAALAGTLGSGFYVYWTYLRPSASAFRGNPPLPFRRMAIAGASAWVFIPAVVLLSRQDSQLTAPVAMLAACLLAVGLRQIIPANPNLDAAQEPPALFAASLDTPPYEVHSLAAALGLYTATYALANDWFMDASSLFAACAFFFAWRLTLVPAIPTSAKPIRRLALAIPVAIVLTLFTLLSGIGHRNHLEAIAAAAARANAALTQTHPAADGITGYHSVILWPPAEKKQILAPIPQPASILAPGAAKPLVIRFDGPYWYFQPPNRAPSPHAHQAHGTPLAVDIQTNNALPLIMEAHQALAAPIPLSRVREIQLGLLNRDNRAGMINVALLLTDSTAPPDVQVDLGQQLIPSTDPAHFTIKFAAPVAETLHFVVPTHAALRKFDGITVMFFPDTAHFNIGRKVAIDQFRLIPR